MYRYSRWLPSMLLGLAGVFVWRMPVNAHGAIATYEQTVQVRVQTQFDTGKPMAGAQVLIYSPNAPKTVWLTGKTDAQGAFEFVPDPEQPGNWQVMVRQAGHGQALVIPVGGEDRSIQSPSPRSWLQTTLMAGSALWGLLGTALFFSRRPSSRRPGPIATVSFSQESGDSPEDTQGILSSMGESRMGNRGNP